MKSGMGKRLAELEAAAVASIKGRVHQFFAWSSWDRERMLDDYGRDKVAPEDEVQFLVWRDDHLVEPLPYDPDKLVGVER